jgi:osmotically-inducible protein OsmY
MAVSSILSPLSEQLREDTNPDFFYSSARPVPYRSSATDDNTDQQLECDLCQAFQTVGYAQLRHIDINCHDGNVTLQGNVPTYFLKQLAQSLALSRTNVTSVDNRIEVICPQ